MAKKKGKGLMTDCFSYERMKRTSRIRAWPSILLYGMSSSASQDSRGSSLRDPDQEGPSTDPWTFDSSELHYKESHPLAGNLSPEARPFHPGHRFSWNLPSWPLGASPNQPGTVPTPWGPGHKSLCVCRI